MKIPAKRIVVGLITIGILSCASGKKSEEQVFKDTPHYQVLPGEQARELSDIKLFVPIVALPQREIELDSVYFRNRKAALLPEGKEMYVAVFNKSGRSKDFVMDVDPGKEFGNQVPVMLEKIPFELAADEAVVVFSRNGKKGYYKLDGIRKR